MKYFISFFILFTVAIRPILPLLNYAVNYDYIAQNLCEKKDIPDSTCKGKCYVGKELAKSERQNRNLPIKISIIDVFIPNGIFYFSKKINPEFLDTSFNSYFSAFYTSEYFSKIFRPPLV